MPQPRVVQFPSSTPPNPDTVVACEILLAEALAGKLVGLAYISLYRGNEHAVDLVGEAKTRPVFTRGVLPDLHEDLTKIIHQHRS